MIDWIDDKLAISDIEVCSFSKLKEIPEGCLVIDVRNHFKQVYEYLILGTMPKDSIWRLIDSIFELQCQGWKIILHCYAGIDRAPFVAALYLAIKQDLPLDAAYNLVIHQRPQTRNHPEWIEWARIELTRKEVLSRGI